MKTIKETVSELKKRIEESQTKIKEAQAKHGKLDRVVRNILTPEFTAIHYYREVLDFIKGD